MHSSPISLEQFSCLTRLIYQAALDQSKWQEFVSALAIATRTPQSQMFGFDHFSHRSIGMLHHNLDPDYMRSYNEHFTHQNFWAHGLLSLDENSVWHSDQIASREFIESTEFYHDWLRPQEDILRGAAAVIFKGPSRTLMMGCNVRRKDDDGLEEGWMQVSRLLIPHIRQAFSMASVIASECNEIGAAGGRQAEEFAATMVVSGKAKLISANTAAERLLEDGRIAKLGHHAELRFNDVEHSLCFQSALHGLRNRQATISKICLGIDRVMGPFELRLAKVSPSELPNPFTLHFDEEALLITIGCHRSSVERITKIQRSYSLTSAEAIVSSAFVAGMNLREIAATRQVSLFTVRNQLKTAMQKLGVNSQLELMRVLRNI